MFLDDDVYMCPGWDEKLRKLSNRLPLCLVSGHAHPFNQAEQGDGYSVPLLISTVNFVMLWEMWDQVGFFVEPGGPGGSEDYDWCMRAKAKGYGFAVTDPHSVIHCGLTSSNGNKIVGYEQMMEQNRKLVELYGLQGKVTYE